MNYKVPLVAELFLKLLIPTEMREQRLGDFEEVFQYTAESEGIAKARIWYWEQTFRSIPGLIYNSVYWGVAMFLNYLKIGLRNIVKDKFYSSINILGFAVSLAAFILISLYVQNEFSYDRYHKYSDNIYRVVRNKPGGPGDEMTKTAVTPSPLAPLLLDEFPEILSATRFIKTPDVIVKRDNQSFVEDVIFWTEPESFKMFTIPFLSGNSRTALDDPYSIVLSEKRAIKFFGTPNAIGKNLTINTMGKEFQFRVAGVINDMPDNSHFKMDVILPIGTFFKIINRPITSWQGNFIYTYLRLKDKTNVDALEAKFPDMLDKQIYEKYNINIEDKYKERLVLQPLTYIHLNSHRNQEIEQNGDYTDVMLLASFAILFLIIASINYINLSTAKAGKRSREVVLRKVVGAQRKQLVMQFFSESMILTGISFLISLLIVFMIMPVFSNFVEKNIGFNLQSNPGFFIGLIFLVGFIGLFAGSTPAIVISGFNPVYFLRGNLFRNSKGFRLRNLLVVVQFVITVLFITFTFIVQAQLDFIRNKNLGYDKEQIVTIKVMEPGIEKNIDAVKSDLMKYSGIINASASYKLPNNIDEHRGVYMPDSDPFMIYYNSADYNYVDLYDIKIVEGRNFSKDYPGDADGAFLVNEAAVKAAHLKNPIGTDLKPYLGISGKIVGVMKDFHLRSFHFPIDPVYIRLDPRDISFLSIKISPHDIPAALSHIESVIKKYSPAAPFVYNFFDDIYNAEYKNEQKLKTVFIWFAGLAVVVACLGLLGLTTFAAASRTKEIGIRKAIGASNAHIFILMSKEFVKWVAIANLISWPLAYFFIEDWLAGFAFRVKIGPSFFFLSGLTSLVITIVTVSYHSYKASIANPVDSIKYE